jgi:hypothetical protein
MAKIHFSCDKYDVKFEVAIDDVREAGARCPECGKMELLEEGR